MAARKIPQELTRDNIDQFMQQFDCMVCDCDGVLWLQDIFANTKESMLSLRQAGKRLLFVTNNPFLPPHLKFEKYGLSIDKNDTVHPPVALSLHLKKIGFNKKIYVIGCDYARHHLQSCGYVVVPEKKTARLIEEDLKAVLNEIDNDPDVGAVFVDADLNICYIDIVKAMNYLERPDCYFFAGATETHMPVMDKGKKMMGPGPFLRILEDMTGRKAVVFGKPSPLIVTESFQNDVDFGRAIFVGDSLPQDMGVAQACGMKKLLVLTGLSTLKDIQTCDPELIPDYYIKSFGEFANLLPRS